MLSVLYKALASRLLALENASELQEEAVALCVSVGASRASALEAAQQRAAKRWWRERALAFEQVLEGWRDAAMLEQWPVVAAGTDMFAEAAAEDSLYCPELRMVVDLHVEDVD